MCHYEVLPRVSPFMTIPDTVVLPTATSSVPIDKSSSNSSRPDADEESASCAVPTVMPPLFHSWLLEKSQEPILTKDVHSAVQHVQDGSCVFDSTENRKRSPIQNRESGSNVEEEPSSMEWTLDPSSTSSSSQTTNPPAHQPKRDIHPDFTPQAKDSHATPNAHYQTTTTNNTSLKNRMTTPLAFPTSKFYLSRWDVLKYCPANTSRLLRRRPVTTLSALLRGNHLQATFESYVWGFDEGVLPPFIHSTVRNDVGEMVAEALRNCKTIVPMYRGKEKACKALVIKTMMLEVQRIHDEVNFAFSFSNLQVPVSTSKFGI